MTRFVVAFLLAAAALPAQAATCLFHVGGVTYFDGPCQFLPYGGEGSFEMVSGDGWVMAEVSLVEPGVAEGWWNENSGAAAAGSPLGTLYRDIRDPACWVNGYATLCAW
jgi:hypothetical protein